MPFHKKARGFFLEKGTCVNGGAAYQDCVCCRRQQRSSPGGFDGGLAFKATVNPFFEA